MAKDYYNIETWVSTHVGKVRNNNEDNFLFFNLIVDDTQKELAYEMKSDTDEIRLFGVFDGMGGHEFGERASFMTADIAQSFTLDESMIEEGLNQICMQANYLVCEEMRKLRQRIGTTASMIAMYKNQAVVCNIGDTPIYLFRNNELIPIYEEHTERRMYERLYGVVDSKKKYRLTQNIGVFEEEMMIKPYVNRLDVKHEDLFLITSDGLTDMVDSDVICELLPQKNALEKLQEKALEAGGKDNITMILIRVEKKSFFERILSKGSEM